MVARQQFILKSLPKSLPNSPLQEHFKSAFIFFFHLPSEAPCLLAQPFNYWVWTDRSLRVFYNEHTRTHVLTHARTHVLTHTHARTHARTHTHTHVRMHVLTHTRAHRENALYKLNSQRLTNWYIVVGMSCYLCNAIGS